MQGSKEQIFRDQREPDITSEASREAEKTEACSLTVQRKNRQTPNLHALDDDEENSFINTPC